MADPLILSGDNGKTKEKTAAETANGYVLGHALFVLFLIMLSAALLFAQAKNTLILKQAEQTSRLDLLVMEEANRMARESAWRHRCSPSQDQLSEVIAVPSDSVSIREFDGTSVRFQNYGAMIEAIYNVRSHQRIYRLYYDDFGILKIEWAQ